MGKYIIEKGSVAIDGISLTVASVSYSRELVFSVAVIPHTWENTTLSKKQVGSTVNIECDVVGKYVEHFMNFDSIQKKALEEPKSIQDFLKNFPSYHIS